MTGKKTDFREGVLVEVIRNGSWTLCSTKDKGSTYIKECPVEEYEVRTHPESDYSEVFRNIEGKIGLVVTVIRNRLEQAVGYRILIEGKEMFCKAKVAEKYCQQILRKN
tara:strand:- start:502 stop:828 length:327 start_codon:yes stop_codon:yes gene_type:complete